MSDFQWQEVSKKTWDDFVAHYPRSLEYHVTAICEPPLGSYNDFTLGIWPESMVAKVALEYPDRGEKTYYLKVPFS